MRIWQKFLSSSLVLAALICLMMTSAFRLYQAETAAEKIQKRTAYALSITHSLEKALKDQALALKDFVVLGYNITNMIQFQKIRSNFLIDLDKLEFVMDEVPELSFVRRRHAFLTHLANTIDSKNNLVTSQQDLQAINSYIQDITFYLADISQKAQKQNNTANERVARIRKMNTNFQFLGIIGIFLIFLFKLIMIILPVIRSLHKLQIGVAKIGAGDLNYHLDIKTNDEIEQLADEFNQMTMKLRDFYYSLESRVSERTSELFELNQDLQTEIVDRRKAEINLKQSQIQLTQKAQELEQALQELQQTQIQLIQNEKMSSLGQLVAGIAHEINNPVNFIHGNITPLEECFQNLIQLINLYQTYYPQPVDEIQYYMEDIDLPFIVEDTSKIIASLDVGAKRIREIVLSLRNFSRLDEADIKEVNIHEGIDNTLLILQHRIKGKPQEAEIEVIKNYGDLPVVECYPGQLNQVFMNIISNAIDALEEHRNKNSLSDINTCNKRIYIQTKLIKNDRIAIHIVDNGMGIPEESRNRIFDPFFTTKPIGKGTGLGLSISYQVITAKHEGKLQCITTPGKGTEFIIELPIKQHN
ncbi:HAMP domain-containing protein [Anabaena sphaerica FACHB-251]|uniref:histidine kinase n=1 Tax=Anabaena sphaerica FACHB-251 TaxID=2692883 RepID=A0A927A0G8_9NOST|nr:ATP-binding protein [Anabaena sphaerica]MBD2293408.1 HAMP domain-containing protein [Anabaena sphaerica FACHB-251]